ncbi:CGNR zinc finger domain-containing protein [Streptomyces sp. NPDC059070]|uniref:CGNR zinc finger domain-containing protein n=1 Tax=unclassified Streptomyces TaxID=2593676 RepID=UPI0034E2AA40
MDAAERLPTPQGPAPGEAEHDSLALVNTEYALPGGPYEGLPDGVAAGRWLRERGFGGAGKVTQAELRRLRMLREAVRAVFSAHIAGEGPDDRSLKCVNEALAAAPGVRELTWSAEGPRLAVRERSGTRMEAVLTQLAEDGAELLTGESATKLSACGAQGCTRLFIRAHAARRWCSDRCGNRVRAARHYGGRGRGVE